MAIFTTPLNDVKTSVAANYTAGSGSIQITDVSRMGTPSASAPIRLTFIRLSDGAKTVLKITNITGNVATVAGALEGYTDINLNTNDLVESRFSAGYLTDIHTAVTAGSLQIGNAVVNGSAKNVLFVDTSGNLAGSASLIWDDATKTFKIKAAVGQSANLFEVQNSSGTSLLSLNSSGTQLIFGGISGGVIFNSTSTSYIQYDGTNLELVCPLTTQFRTGSSYLFKNNTASAEYMRITSTGVGIGDINPGAQLQVTASAFGTKGLIVKAAALQTATLTEWQNSSGAFLTRVMSDGSIRIGTGTFIGSGSAGLEAAYSADTEITSTGSNNPSFRAISTTNTVTTKIQSVNSNTSGNVGTESNHALNLLTNNTARMSISNAGDFSTNGASGLYHFQIGGVPKNTVHLGLTPSSLSSGDIIIYGTLPSVTGSVNPISINGSATTGLISTISNTSATSTANASFGLSTLSTGGDPLINWNISTIANWQAGIDNSDSDKWKLSSDAGGKLEVSTVISAATDGTVAIPKTLLLGSSGSLHGVINSTDGLYFNTDCNGVGGAVDGRIVIGNGRLYDTGGTVWAYFHKTGKLGIANGTTTPDAQVQINASSASTKGLIVKAAASQSANLFETQNSSGTALTTIDATGHVSISANAGTQLSITDTSGLGVSLVSLNGVSSGWSLRCQGNASDAFWLFNNTTALKPIIVQTDGTTTFGGASSVSGVQLSVITKDAITKTLIARAATTLSRTVTNVALASNVATITTSVAHGFVVGATVVISGLTTTALNGTYTVASAPTTTTFTFTKANANIASTADSGTAIVSQTANIQEWQDGTGTTLASVSSSGSFTVPTLNSNSTIYLSGNPALSFTSTDRFIWSGSNSIRVVKADGAASLLTILNTGLIGVNEGSPSGQFQITASSAATKGLIVKAAASQTANLTEWQDNNGTTSASVVPTNSEGGGFGIRSGSTVYVETGVNGSNFPYLKSSTNGLYLSTNNQSTGYAHVNVMTNSAYGLRIASGSSNSQAPTIGRLYVDLLAPTNKGIVVQSAASQTANLTEWQNSSGTVLTSIDPSGNLATKGIISNITSATGTMASFGANSVANLLTFSYDLTSSGGVGITGSTFGPIDIVTQSNQNINLKPNGTGYIGISSAVGIGMTTTPGAQLQINTSATTKGLIIKGSPSQSANFFEAQDSTGVALATIGPNGEFSASNRYTRPLTRIIPTTVGDAVDIGTFTIVNGSANMQICVTIPSGGYSTSKYYNFSVLYNQTNNVWTTVIPFTSSGPYDSGTQDADLEAKVSSGVIFLRLRRTLGTINGTATITIDQQGTAATFTPSTTVNTVTAPTTFFPATNITQMGGKVGINIMAPSAQFHMVSSSASTKGVIVKGGTTVATITNVALTSNVATITTSAAHSLTVGQTVVIAGLTNTALNGTYVIASTPTSTTFTFAKVNANIASVADSGTATGQQTANLIECQNSTGTYLAGITSGGNFSFNSVAQTVPFNHGIITDNAWAIYDDSSIVIGKSNSVYYSDSTTLIVESGTNSSPTQDIQKWRVAGAGATSLASISAKGEIKAKGLAVAIASKTSAYVLTTSDAIITGDATGADFAVTLPAANAVTAGREYTVKNIGATGTVTLTAAGSDTIDGTGTYPLASQFKFVTVVSDGSSKWHIIGSN